MTARGGRAFSIVFETAVHRTRVASLAVREALGVIENDIDAAPNPHLCSVGRHDADPVFVVVGVLRAVHLRHVRRYVDPGPVVFDQAHSGVGFFESAAPGRREAG